MKYDVVPTKSGPMLQVPVAFVLDRDALVQTIAGKWLDRPTPRRPLGAREARTMIEDHLWAFGRQDDESGTSPDEDEQDKAVAWADRQVSRLWPTLA